MAETVLQIVVECGRGWGTRCGGSEGKRCRCRCGGKNHGQHRRRGVGKIQVRDNDGQTQLVLI